MTVVQRAAPNTATHNVLILVIQLFREQVRTGAANTRDANVVLQRVDIVRCC